MKLIKNEVGSSLSETMVLILLVLIVTTFAIRSIIHNDTDKNLKAYFSIEPHKTKEKDLVKPWVNKRLEELKKIAIDASAAVEAIRSEPESLDPEGLKEKLERMETSQKIEEFTWSDWRRACRAAKWEGYVQTCDATK